MDGISVELYKAYLKKAVKDEYGNITEYKILEVFQRLFTVVLKYQTTPENWTDRVLVIIWKKGNVVDIANYRPIILINADYKILSLVLIRRLVEALSTVVGDYQTAFLKGRLIDDNIRTIQGLVI